MAEWKDLLEREDIVGGQIQIHIKEEGVFRSSIAKVEILDGTVHFRTNWTLKEEPGKNGKSEWVKTKLKIHYFETSQKLFGSLTGRVQFDIPKTSNCLGGWAIIFPVGDVSLIQID